jgi:hypothetical protein
LGRCRKVEKVKETFPKPVRRFSGKELLESSSTLQHLLSQFFRGDVGKLKR